VLFRSPPEAAEGSTLSLILTCGLLDGPSQKDYELRGERWFEVGGVGNGVFESLEPCLSRQGGDRDDKFMVWDDDTLYMSAGGLDHDLTPTTVTDRWFGEVTSAREPSRACVDALADLGLAFPIALTVEIIEVDLVD
jgi:hypothetical protein